ncbi:ABC transporter ATP-binding protein [Acidimangrovimonas sediminis]|uniref:ABC transporter ATP-binding protein n=1 Tax=Acidimangrovimonas sediminis TaxID=2056283 RepID=UPI000C80D423|nr:ABC transporter ATP-binding protein [Acidimangrovimonas sediminis]
MATRKTDGPAGAGGERASAGQAPLLEIDRLCVSAHINGQDWRALENITLRVDRGETRGLVGESGSGKSLTLRAAMGLLPGSLSVTSGAIRFKGRDLLADGGKAMAAVRGTGIAMVFQEPAVALNPVMRVGRQITDSVSARRGWGRRQAREFAVELMDQVGIRDPKRWVEAYPHQLSGGMRQRVMIASAIACGPELIFCDEPTTALDVTVQSQILKLFSKLQADLHAGFLYVTHDLSVVAEFCSSLSVMYAGRIVEQSDDLKAMVQAPVHPYTRALLGAVPRIKGPIQRLRGLSSSAPPLTERSQAPTAPLAEVSPGWQVAPASPEEVELFETGVQAWEAQA